MFLRAARVRPVASNAQGIRQRRKDGGFTLLELLAVLVILAVIIAIAVPLIGNVIERARQDATIGTAGQIAEAARLYLTTERNGQFAGQTVRVKELVDTKYLNQPYDGWGNAIDQENSNVKFGEDGDLESVTLVSEKLQTKTFTAEMIRNKQWE